MRDQELEARLARAATQAAPHDLDGVLSRCQEQNGKVVPMTKTKTTSAGFRRGLIAACLALALIGGGAGVFLQQATAVASVVSIDVNPSIELRVNRDEKVLSCTPVNEEAHIALGEMNDGKDLEGAKLTVAVNAIVGALVRHGYLDGLSNAILVSVEDKDQARAARMEEELRTSISGILQAEAPNTTVLSQTLTPDAGERVQPTPSQSETTPAASADALPQPEATPAVSTGRVHPISSGKTALVNQVMALSGSTDTAVFDQLAALSVEELSDLLETRETRIPIGKSAACQAAQAYAGTLSLGSNVARDVDPELDKRPAYYEVELVVSGIEYEYRVDAFTGEVLSGRADIVTSAAATPTPAATPAPTPAPTLVPTPTPTSVPAVTPAPVASGVIGEDAAWAAVCTHAGCALGDMSYTACELDYEDGIPECYEIEFCWNGNQYEYEVDCYAGTVLQCEWEVCDNGLHNCGGGGRHHGWGHH